MARLRAGALRDDDVHVGVMHADNERESRGGLLALRARRRGTAARRCRWWWRSTAAPATGATSCGAGSARRAAGACCAVADRAGSDMVDHGRRGRRCGVFEAAIESVAGRYPVDRWRVLLTGMSDGGNLRAAAGCATARPSRIWRRSAACCIRCCSPKGLAQAQGRPIYLIHGALDWMFPVHTARMARDALPRRARESSIARSRISRTPIRATRTRESSSG